MRTLSEVFVQGQSLLSCLPHPELDARILLCESLSVSEEQFFFSPETVPSKRQKRRFFRLVQKRRRGFPLAYLTGKKEFWSIVFEVNPGVLIPRPETELLVEKTLGVLKKKKGTIVDIGTGCGNIAVCLAKELPEARILATDISKRALKTARVNARKHNVSGIDFRQGNMFVPLGKLGLENRCDVIVSNPPYVSEIEWEGLSAEINKHEPKNALVSGETGLENISELIGGSVRYLKTGGHLLFEVGDQQKKEVQMLFKKDWDDVCCFEDLSGIPRVFRARKA